MTREHVDSREAFTSQELEAYEYEPTETDLEEMCDYFDSLDYDEEEWQDLWGGDDLDQGQ